MTTTNPTLRQIEVLALIESGVDNVRDLGREMKYAGPSLRACVHSGWVEGELFGDGSYRLTDSGRALLANVSWIVGMSVKESQKPTEKVVDYRRFPRNIVDLNPRNYPELISEISDEDGEDNLSAIRPNVIYDDRGKRIPGIRFSPSYVKRSDGEIEWTGVSIVPFPEDEE